MSNFFFLFHIVFIASFSFYHFQSRSFSSAYLFYPNADYSKLSFEKREILHHLHLREKIDYILVSIFNGPKNPFFETFFSRRVIIQNSWIYLDKLIITFNRNFFIELNKQPLDYRNLLLKSILFSIFLSFDQIDQIQIYIQVKGIHIPLTRYPFRKKDLYQDNREEILNFFLRESTFF